MPTILPDQCYKTLPAPVLRPGAVLNIEAMAKALAAYSIAETVDSLRAKLNNHLKTSTYTYKKQLIDSFQVVQAYFLDPACPEGQKQQIADKLTEGLGNCTPGFHDRVNSILLGLVRPQSIDAFLELLRIAIVDATARQTSDDVHLHNSFFIHAATAGYGVRPLHKRDVHSRALTEQEAQSLTKAFNERYTALPILEGLLSTIEGELRSYYGYQGENLKGYVAGDTEKMINLLKNVLGESFSYEKAFLVNDNDSVRDLNWLSISEALWNALRDQQYLAFSTAENTLFEALYRQEDPWSLTQNALLEVLRLPDNLGSSESETRIFEAIFRTDGYTLLSLLEQSEYQDLIFSLKFIEHPGLITHLNAANRECLIKRLFNTSPTRLSLEGLSKYLSQLSAWYPENSAVQKEAYQAACKSWLEKAENKSTLSKAISTGALADQRQALSLLPYLSPLELEELLLLKDEHGNNALMMAARSQSTAVGPLLEALAALPEVIWIALLAQNKDGNNALMQAARYQPTAIAPLLEALAAFPKAIQIAVLTQKDAKNAWDCDCNGNALMMAVRHQPTVIAPLLEALAALPEAVQIEVLTQKDAYGNNALMMAARYQPMAVGPFLETLPALPEATWIALLTQQNRDGNNALMRAVCSQPTAIAPLLAALAALPEVSQITVLTQQNKNGTNALMMAAEHQPTAIAPLLERLAALPAATQIEVLTQKDAYGCNALMMAARSQSTAVGPLLEALAALPKATQIAVLTQQNEDGTNALMRAAWYQPTVMPLLLETLKTFTLSTQKLILKTIPSFVSFEVKKQISHYKNHFLNEAIAALDNLDPLERNLKQSLHSMSWGAEDKRIAILDAFNELKKNLCAEQQTLRQAVYSAITDSDSALYKALNMKGHGPSFFHSESTSLRRLKEEVDKELLFYGTCTSTSAGMTPSN